MADWSSRCPPRKPPHSCLPRRPCTLRQSWPSRAPDMEPRSQFPARMMRWSWRRGDEGGELDMVVTAGGPPTAEARVRAPGAAELAAGLAPPDRPGLRGAHQPWVYEVGGRKRGEDQRRKVPP